MDTSKVIWRAIAYLIFFAILRLAYSFSRHCAKESKNPPWKVYSLTLIGWCVAAFVISVSYGTMTEDDMSATSDHREPSDVERHAKFLLLAICFSVCGLIGTTKGLADRDQSPTPRKHSDTL